MKILNDITPSKKEKEKVGKAIDEFFKEFKPYFKDAELLVGGSIAKDTWLSGSYDIDVFVKFPYEKYKDKDISKILERKLKKYNKLHGSRDYFQVSKGKFTFELIPVLDINNAGKAKNITDISPLHTLWVKKSLVHPNQARLAKQFCRANDLYGAESYIRGFSGYVLEILISKYGTFFDLAKNAANWRRDIIVDIAGHYGSRKELLEKMNKSKISTLVVVDPVQASRNAAASLSEDKYIKFVELCKEFMRNPSENFFIKSKFSLRDLRREAGNDNFSLLKVYPIVGKKDIVGSKLLKAFVYITKKLGEYGFEVRNHNWKWEGGKGGAYFWFYVKKSTLPEYYRHYGPPVKEKKNLEGFKNKWGEEEIKEEDGRVYVEVTREFRRVQDYMKMLLKDKYLHENVKKIKMKKITWMR